MLLVLAGTALAGDGGLAALPFGVGLFAHRHPVRGTAYALTQAAGAGFAVWGAVDANEAAELEDLDRVDRDQVVVAVAVSAAALSYAVSLVDGSRAHELQCVEASARLGALETWDKGVARAGGRP